MSYSVIKPASIRTLVAAEGGQAFQQRAGERRRRASSLQLASPPVATRNGLACLLLESAILTHRLCYRPGIEFGHTDQPWVDTLRPSGQQLCDYGRHKPCKSGQL